MSWKAWVYIGAVLVGGAVLTVLEMPSLAQPLPVWEAWAALTVLTTLALLLRAVFTMQHGADGGSTAYSPVLMFLLAAALLLPTGPMILLIVVSHLIQWGKERLARSGNLPAWYIQPFNMAVYIISGCGAQELWGYLHHEGPIGFDLMPLLAALLVCLAYQALNSVLIGEALVLARGVTWRASGILEPENLLADLVMLTMGVVDAVLWQVSPWLSLLALAPLVLISRALQVPQLKKEAQTDGKTGLLNASHFSKLFGLELERASRFDRSLALFMADLDFLRNINNTYGHLAGDIVLAGIGRIIRETVRQYDLAARFGGEEFAVLLPESGRAEALALAERLRQRVAATPFVVPTSPTPIHVTISIGIACYPEDAHSATRLIHAADVAVYQAKLSGRDRVVCAGEISDFELLGGKMPTGVLESQIGGLRGPKRPADQPLPPAPAAGRQGLGAATVLTPLDDQAGHSTPQGDRAQGLPAPASVLSGSVSARSDVPRPLAVYVGSVIAIAVAVTALGFSTTAHLDGLAIGLLVLLAACFEFLQINIYGPATTSANVTIIFTAALLTGVPGVCLVGATMALVHFWRQRPAPYKTVFNWANYVLAGAVVDGIMSTVGLLPAPNNLLWLLIPAVVAAFGQFAVNTGLVAGAISLAGGHSFLRTWREEFQWLMGHYLVLSMMGLLLTLAFNLIGPIGALVFVLPIVMMRYAQEQYVERTKTGVAALTRMNDELAQANHDIVSANNAIQRLNSELFITVARILDARDPYVGGHAAQVSMYAAATAYALHLPSERVETIRQAGFLHDVGKIAIPEQILHKPARLTPEEYEIIQTHAVIGAEFLSSSQALQHLAPFVRGHHERWDGRGYPDGLRAEEIPIEARILAVCDAVEAMASDRPYQRGKSIQEIIAELQRCAGSHFDPAVSAAFIGLLEHAGETFVVNSAREVGRRHSQTREGRPVEREAFVRAVPSWVS